MDYDRFKSHIWRAATLSKAVYDADESGIYDDPTLSLSGFVAADNAFAMVLSGASHIWVAIAGTNEGGDWKTNIDFEFTALGNISSTHSGFYEHGRKLDADISQLIRAEIDTNPRPVVFVGHSLGGAVATILATTYKRSGVDASAIVFGCPRVFSCSASIRVNNVLRVDIQRVENVTDIITDVPTRYGKRRYCHVGRALHFDSKGRAITEERPPAVRAWFSFRRLFRRVWVWDVHSMAEYRRRLLIWKGEQ